MNIKKKLRETPSSPGVYLMKGPKDRIIYVGKAKNLKNRLRSYFQRSSAPDQRKIKMVKEIRDFDYVVTRNELEALILEANFIKKSKPKYNIILRDDKNYPYLKLTVKEDWPKLEVVRTYKKDGSLYFGPYVPSGVMREMLRFIKRNFRLRTCRYNLEKPFRPCVQHQMKRCLAPCAKNLREQTDRVRYKEEVNTAKLFLQGKKKALLRSLNKKMQMLSEDLKFEEAAKLRDGLRHIETAWETQRVISPELGDMDAIGMHREDDQASVFILFIRNGIIIGQKGFFLDKLSGIKDRELVESFIEQFYSKETPPPPRIILPLRTKLTAQQNWLSKKRHGKIEFSFATGKKETGILKMAMENAGHFFRGQRAAKISPSAQTLRSLKDLLDLKKLPKRICAVDVSNISGSEAVGALVEWEDGKFIKDDYRLFKIRTVEGIDDFAMIGEVVGRHFRHLSGRKTKLPNLFIVDGGRGQLKAALKAMGSGSSSIETVAMAKARPKEKLIDRVYLPGKRTAVPLEPSRPETHLLQQIRDEAHRFAVNYHKKLRIKRVLESPIEKIKGIGKTRRLLLLRHFGSIDNIRKASIEEIASLKSMNRKTAEMLKASL